MAMRCCRVLVPVPTVAGADSLLPRACFGIAHTALRPATVARNARLLSPAMTKLCHTDGDVRPNPGQSASLFAGARSALVRPRPFFSLIRRSAAALVGRVGRRARGGGAVASFSNSTNRCSAALLFCSCERCSDAAITTHPSTNLDSSLTNARARRWSLNPREFTTSNINCALESVVFTLWPPGPDDLVNFHINSACGITTDLLTIRSSATA